MIGGPCRTCGTEHDCTVWEPGQRVRVLRARNYELDRYPSLVGAEGIVHSWGRYGGPLWIRVQFSRKSFPALPYGRSNFDPCGLDVIAPASALADVEVALYEMQYGRPDRP